MLEGGIFGFIAQRFADISNLKNSMLNKKSEDEIR